MHVNKPPLLECFTLPDELNSHIALFFSTCGVALITIRTFDLFLLHAVRSHKLCKENKNLNECMAAEWSLFVHSALIHV